MFKKELAIIYKKKDLEEVKQMGKLIDSLDDTPEEIVGTKDQSIRIYPCSEERWLEKSENNRKRMADKFLFVGNIRGTELLEPDFEKYGVAYGCEGKYIALTVDDRYAWTREEYDAFLQELKQLYERAKFEYEQQDGLLAKEEREQNKNNKKKALMIAGSILFPPAVIYPAVKTAKNIKNDMEDRKIIHSQMILYGLFHLYYNHMEEYMNLKTQ